MSSPFALSGRSTAFPRLAACALVSVLMLSACGGGGGSPGVTSGSSQTSTSPTTGTTPVSGSGADPIPSNYQAYANSCAAPRSGVDAEGVPFPDRQGTLQDEFKFLRGWIDSTYLWYNEVPGTVHMADYTNAIDYFGALKTPLITASGKPKDQFHFTYTTAEWDAMSNASQDTGYGLTWSFDSTTAPRTWRAAIVEPGSPGANAGLQRGDQLMQIDGLDFVNTADKATLTRINAGLYPAKAGEQHVLTFQRGGAQMNLTLTSAVVTSAPVKNVKVIDTPTGRVGYLSFEDHNAVSEQQLVSAFSSLKSQGATDLVLDMRYNGGGLLYIASELAYMIAGPAANGKTFEQERFNDKTQSYAPIQFMSTAYGFSAAKGMALPYLGLKHVTVLSTADTCSASEAVINGLRGIDVQVDIIGGQTCGKPYGFTPQANCGTTYFAIQFQGVNAKGFGDFADGFAPTCTVSDDLSHPLGDTSEGLLAAALAYRSSNSCPAVRTGTVQRRIARSAVKQIAILPPRAD
jgi:carboxyl-terminal processing protease